MRKNKPTQEILHECLICGNKWSAKFEVKHCFGCEYDERTPGALPAIQRTIIIPITASDGNSYIPLKLIRVIPKGEEDAEIQE